MDKSDIKRVKHFWKLIESINTSKKALKKIKNELIFLHTQCKDNFLDLLSPLSYKGQKALLNSTFYDGDESFKKVVSSTEYLIERCEGEFCSAEEWLNSKLNQLNIDLHFEKLTDLVLYLENQEYIEVLKFKRKIKNKSLFDGNNHSYTDQVLVINYDFNLLIALDYIKNN